MKMPSLDLQSVGDALLRHGEKIVAAGIGLLALLLAWGGVSAWRTLSVTEAHTPEAVARVVGQARDHIDREAQAPADLLPERESLAEKIDPWRTPLVPWSTSTAAPSLTINDAAPVAVLDRPLFEEAAKRDKPSVFPIEDLRAVAGLAILPAGGQDQPQAPADPRVQGGPGRRPPRGAETSGLDGAVPSPDGSGDPQAFGERRRILPYVVVTGLIPARKQHEEYRRRFEPCGFRDPKRDSPLWSDFEIDRCTVAPDGKETWTKIDLAAVARQRAADWGAAVAADAVPIDPQFLLAAGEDLRSRPSTPIGFCSPLPQRLDGDWDLADLHPWVIERLIEKRAAEPRPGDVGAVVEPAGPGPGPDGPGFDGPEEPRPDGAAPAQPELPEYRLFRFVDTDVVPGTTYRYRARLKVWNPNYDKVPERMRPHLVDPSLAKDQKLSSTDSSPSTAATVPDKTRILVATLRPDEFKELRIRPGSGTREILVLGPSERTGSFALRAVVADPGVVVDVDEKHNLKGQRDRARGEKIETRRLFVDARGQQEERGGGTDDRGKATAAIPEPFEALCLKPDGSFEFASLGESDRWVNEYRATLPPRSVKEPKGQPMPDGSGEQPLDPANRPRGRGL